MKTMGTRCAMLLLSLVALLQLEMPMAARSRRPQATKGPEGPDNGKMPSTSASDNHERGDVPGWVMITLMSAVLVAALLALAGPALEAMFNQAMDKVGS
ncbi:hypothetical protein QFZ35_002256 [Arthrobacter ulcerisalmonis]|uniref:hypothetical protein n=1 Tax=Arthrobacter sp. B1I2 TaxID=3042263 RepID=UPI00278B419B|nr:MULTISPECIES: hypothetical protein [Arthrobacter]MDQ0663758.1 hypothetical protein [Arthrobacter ulcerisalmonis]MDQ0731642.1 hypothetical protein [Arthrobacter sp. B1I2]